ADAYAAWRARTARPRRSPAAPARPATAPRAGPARPAPPGRTPRRGHTRARTECVLTGCASGTLLGSVPARDSPKTSRGHWFWGPPQSLGAAVFVGWCGGLGGGRVRSAAYRGRLRLRRPIRWARRLREFIIERSLS